MKDTRAMAQMRKKQRILLATSGVAFVLSLALTDKAVSQSGRRANRTAPSGTTLPAPTPIPEVPAPVRKKFAELRYPVHLLIAKQYTRKHLPSETVIFNNFLHRLNEMPNIEGTLIGDLKRDQAAKRALTETDAYVVLMQFEIDNFQGGKVVINSPDLEVKYFVFPPLSKEPELKGKVYYQSLGGPQGRKANSPTDPPIRITVEAAGHEAAERLYFWLAELVGTRGGGELRMPNP